MRVPDRFGPPPPDTKDWTWVLERPCPECGTDAAALGVAELPDLLRRSSLALGDALRDPEAARRRPAPDRWSPLEYACHVRDVHLVFAERVRAVLAEDGVRFANWDQDAAALAGRYAEQDPVEVELELLGAAGTVAGLYAAATPEQEAHTGLRSNGSAFTLRTLGQYHLHDVLHHLHDVGRPL